MQPITSKELEQLIKETEKAGKDTSKLKAALEELKTAGLKEAKPPAGKTKETKIEKGAVIIESTGPVREEDFE